MSVGRWASVVEREQQAWTPADGAFTTPLRFTYSCEGPQHVELLQGAPGSLWDGADAPGLHHHGVWVDDVAAETERLVAAGWTLEMAQKPPDKGYGAMTYVRAPSGFLLEPVNTTFVERERGRQYFYRNAPRQLGVACHVDFPHSTATD